jgi:hypothetical protein
MLVDSMQGWDQYDETLANLNLALEANIAQEARINAVLDMLDRLPAKATTVSVRKVREALSSNARRVAGRVWVDAPSDARPYLDASAWRSATVTVVPNEREALS